MLYYKFKKTVGALYDDLSIMCEADELKDAINNEAKIGEFYCDNAVYKDGELKLSGEITETAQYNAFFTGVADMNGDGRVDIVDMTLMIKNITSE